jgi:sporulation protein YlmC with PRC-barrel domain
VKNVDGEVLGTIEDLVFDPETLEVEYALVDYNEGQKLFAIPFSILSFQGEEGYFLLPVSKELMEESRSFITFHGNTYYSLIKK